MRVKLNDKIIVIPSSLDEFKLKDRIRFQTVYGSAYEKKIEEANKISDEVMKEAELSIIYFENMLNTFSFFSGIDRDSLEQSEYVDDIASIYLQCMKGLIEEENDIKLEDEYVWNGEIWQIQPPYLNTASKMKFGELIDSKQIVKEMIEFGGGKWEAMPYLCAIYFRKKGEEYTSEFTNEESDRLKLMYELPMAFALRVGFFLSSSLNGYINTYHSSKNQA